MTKEQTFKAIEACVRACYWGATRRTRLAWVLGQTGLSVDDVSQTIAILLKAHMLEDHHGYGWVSVTPFLMSVLDNWDALTQDVEWFDDVSTDADDVQEGAKADETASQDNG